MDKTRIVIAWRMLFITVCGFLTVAVNAQQTSFEQWKKQNKEAFAQYLTEQDKAFAGFLANKWVETNVTTDLKNTAKKLPTAPVAPAQEPKSTVNEPVDKPKPVIADLPSKPKVADDQTPSSAPVIVAKKSTEVRHDSIIPNPQADSFMMSFLGHQLAMPKLTLTAVVTQQLSPQTIADAWVTISQQHSKSIDAAIQTQSDFLNLDDWGKAIFTYRYVQQYAQTTNTVAKPRQRVLYTWYLLVKQGLNVRVAYDSNSLYLLLNTDLPLYAQKYFNFSGDKFYFVDFSGAELPKLNKVFTYETQHEMGAAAINIDVSKVPNLTQNDTERMLSFSYQQTTYQVPVSYHSEYIKLLDLYPQIEVKHYFLTGLNDQSRASLLTPLANMLAGRSEVDALNFLLRFVQKALAYQTDDEQFAKENFMFATEALHYPFADCEDRSVLFSYLVKELMGNKIIGVLYQGHIATAVRLSSVYQGAHYTVGNEKFYIADPTYIGGNLGDVMPGYSQQSPRLIHIN